MNDAYDKEKLVDLLLARRAVERAGVQLYETVIARAKAGALDADLVLNVIPKLHRIRSEELEHAEWLEGQILGLSANVLTRTPSVELVEKESEGLAAVVRDSERSLAEVFHALLGIELLDHAGWHVLLQLADEVHDEETKLAIRTRIWEEDEHLNDLRAIVQSYARESVLGKRILPEAA